MTEMLCWLLAIISLLLYCSSNFKKTKKNIIAERVACNLVDILMYAISGGMTGVVNSIVDLGKNITFVKFNSKKVILLMSSIKIALMIWNYENGISLFIILCELAGVVVIIYGTAQQLRVVSMVTQIAWVIYDYFMVSLFVAIATGISSCFCLISVIVNWNQENISCETI